MEEIAQLSIVKLDDDKYKIIVQNDKEILRSDILNAVNVILKIIEEIGNMKKISDFKR